MGVDTFVLNSFRLKLVAYFVLLSILPMAAAFWGFSTVAGDSKTRQVDARLQAGLRATLAAYQERVDLEQSAAEQMARVRAFQVDLARRDRFRLRLLLREAPDLSVTAPGGFRVGRVPPLAVSRSVDVVTRAGRIGTVVVSLPLDGALVASLRARGWARPGRRARARARQPDRRLAALRARRRRGRPRAGPRPPRSARIATASCSRRPSRTGRARPSPCSARSR